MRRHFTYSKAMAWAAFDRAACATGQWACPAPPSTGGRWPTASTTTSAATATTPTATPSSSPTAPRRWTRACCCSPGRVPARDRPADDRHRRRDRGRPHGRRPRPALPHRPADSMRLTSDTDHPAAADGLPPGEGTFLLCSFWLVDNLALQGRRTRHRPVRAAARPAQRRRPAQRGVRPVTGRLLGNLPQAFSHIGLVNSACRLGGLAAAISAPPRDGHHP